MRVRALSLVMLCLHWTPSAAQTTETTETTETIARAAGWSAYRTLPNTAPARCGIDVTHEATGRYFSINYTEGARVLLILLQKTSWSIPQDTRVPVTMQIDQRPAWTANANGGGPRVRWNFSGDTLLPFIREFQQGTSMTISFPGGTEPLWRFSLQGTTAMIEAMLRCMTEIGRRPAAPTQPFGNRATGPTQPFAPQPGFPQVPVPDAQPADQP